MGNPTSYRGATLTWNGRKLMSYTKDDLHITYKYDADGLRTQKTVNGVQHDYYYVDGQIAYEKVGNEYSLYYRYDQDGRLSMVLMNRLSDNKKWYFYLLSNSRGDIIGMNDAAGPLTVRYNYDAWGKVLSITNAAGTPHTAGNFAHKISVRYRGYYYDEETGLYYLQSRYYDPETGRFLNADDVSYIGVTESEISYNPFVYCENDSINHYDSNGFWSADLHYGRNSKYKNSKKKKYKNSEGDYIDYDGTYEWALELDWNVIYSDKLAYYCMKTDDDKSFLVPSYWKYHFNVNKTGTDSRVKIYMDNLDSSVKKFKVAKNDNQRYKAIKILGQGLHALQDYYAHGSFRPTLKKIAHSKQYDNPFYDWKNNNRNSFSAHKSSVGDRYYYTKWATQLYLVAFMEAIGANNAALLTARAYRITVSF